MKPGYLKKVKRRRAKQVAYAPAKGRLLAAWSWCLLGTVLALGLWTSPYTQPCRIEVQGVPPEGQKEVESTIRQEWTSPFALRTGYGQIEKALQSIAWIESAQIRGDLRGTSMVSIRLRQPFARVETPHRTFWLDRQGVLFIPPNPQQSSESQFSTFLKKDFKERKGDLRLIRMDYDLITTPGRSIKNRVLLDALQVLVQLERTGISGEVTLAIDRSPNMWLNILSPVTGQGEVIRVRLGNGERLHEKVHLLGRLYRADSRLLTRWEYLDLCCPTAPAFKPASPKTDQGGR